MSKSQKSKSTILTHAVCGDLLCVAASLLSLVTHSGLESTGPWQSARDLQHMGSSLNRGPFLNPKNSTAPFSKGP